MTSIDDHDGIVESLQRYIDGSARGDAAMLRAAFHDNASMFGHLGGHAFDVPLATQIDDMAARPVDVDGSYRARVVSVTPIGEVATAVVAEDGCWGQASFVDLFTLVRIDGTWRIANKTFAHTGGEVPRP